MPAVGGRKLGETEAAGGGGFLKNKNTFIQKNIIIFQFFFFLKNFFGLFFSLIVFDFFQTVSGSSEKQIINSKRNLKKKPKHPKWGFNSFTRRLLSTAHFFLFKTEMRFGQERVDV